MKAKTFFIFILLFLVLIACDSEKEISTIDKLRGDWINLKPGRNLAFTFEDSICTFKIFQQKSTFLIKFDTILMITDSVNNKWDKWNYEYKFIINYLSKDSLVLIPKTPKTIEYFSSLKKTAEPITLKKAIKNNNKKFIRLGLYSSYCFGTCPTMYLEIDSFGRMIFDGGYGTISPGFHFAKISNNQLELLNKKIQNIHLESLEPEYDASYTDAQTINLKLIFSKDSLETEVYGYRYEPIQLRILFHYLMQLYTEVDLEFIEDRDIEKEEIKFKEFFMKRHPPPPLPPPDYEY